MMSPLLEIVTDWRRGKPAAMTPAPAGPNCQPLPRQRPAATPPARGVRTHALGL